MKKCYILAICAALFALSCENELSVEVVPAGPKMITVSCVIDNSNTKVSLDKEDGVGKTRWEEGDKVFFHGALVGTSGDKYYSYVAEAYDISEDGKTAFFEIPEISNRFNHANYDFRATGYVADLFAAYPADNIASFKNGDAWYYTTAFKQTNHLLLAGHNDSRVDNGHSFIFYNLTGALSFKVDGSSFGGFDAYSVCGNADETVGYTHYTVRYDADNSQTKEVPLYTEAQYAGATSGDLKSISVDGWTGADGVVNNTVFFPNGVNFESGFTIKFFKNGTEVKRARTKTAKNIQIGKWLDVGLIPTDRLLDPPAHEPAAWTIGAEDLAATETANSYIVYHKDAAAEYSSNAGKAFKIPAVKGNSSTSVGTVGGVEILWETYNNSSSVEANTVVADVDYDSSHIYFKMPSSEKMHAGNALIAAKDALGTILWSWHIWVPSSEIVPYGDISVSSKYWMDRNLGAITGAAGNNGINYGLSYQWGRPHPRVGLDGSGGTTYAKTYPVGAIKTQEISDGEKSKEEAIQNPTLFYINNHCWYNPASEVELWSSTKTIYDPCPAGWMVPAYGILNTSNKVVDAINGGVSISGLYFPGTGGASRYAGTWWEGNCYYWSCDTYVGSDKLRAYLYLLNVDTTDLKEKEYKTTSAPVRCVKIEGEVPPFSTAEINSAENKSASESANCYIVNAGDEANASKVFKFRAVRGNDSVSVGAVATAEVLWETWNSSSVTPRSVIDKVYYNASDGYVYFKMPSELHAGNAVIAVKNAAGTILWSWHIWVPSSDPTATLYSFGGQSWMDRNLGALTVTVASESATADPQSFGFFYAWGRKDPFPGLASLDSSSPVTTTGSFNMSGDQMSMEQSYSLPTTFVKTGSDAKWNWATDAGSTIAGFWGSTKTIYDPCPPGYIVPALTTTSGSLWNGSHASDESKRAAGFTIDGTHMWFKAGESPNFIVFPITGFLDACQSTPYIRRGDRVLIWSSNNTSIDSEKGNLANTLRVYNSSGWKSKNESERHCRGFNVRCVAIPE